MVHNGSVRFLAGFGLTRKTTQSRANVPNGAELNEREAHPIVRRPSVLVGLRRGRQSGVVQDSTPAYAKLRRDRESPSTGEKCRHISHEEIKHGNEECHVPQEQ
jgi:hypothetical protein